GLEARLVDSGRKAQPGRQVSADHDLDLLLGAAKGARRRNDDDPVAIVDRRPGDVVDSDAGDLIVTGQTVVAKTHGEDPTHGGHRDLAPPGGCHRCGAVGRAGQQGVPGGRGDELVERPFDARVCGVVRLYRVREVLRDLRLESADRQERG